jgi:hypothetical protein
MFSHQYSRLQFEKDVHFGDEIDINISRAGDVLKNNIYLRVQWPVVSAGVDNSFGTRMIDFIELLYNTQLLERHYGETMQILNDLTVPLAKQSVLQQLIGTGRTVNLNEYYIRIPFSVSLPLCALEQDPVLRIKFRNLNEISNSVYTGNIGVDLFVDYVYLTEPEKKYFKNNFFDYNSKTYQRLQFNIAANSTNEVVQTNFIGSVSELYWVIQTDGSSDYDFTNLGSEQLVNLQLSFNNIDIIPQDLGTPIFLRYTQSLTYHTSSPSHYFYMYSFSLDPENEQPSGQVDLSCILNQLHNLNLSSCSFSRQLRIYAKTNNIFRVGKGDLKVVSDMIKEAGTTNIISNYYKKQYPGLYYFNTFKFTTLGTFGYVGPTTPNSPNITISSGIQNWTVPTTGIYSITAAGARGTVPGRVLQASNVPLAQGQILSILVGQLSSNIVDFTVPGGGGSTYIVSGNTPLLVAAGGDSGVGAVSSQGFTNPGSGNGNDGAGFYGDGANLYSNFSYLVPRAYVNGGAGNRAVIGTKDQGGGFGGGQAPKSAGISGGGGYTGGPGATSYTSIQNTTDLGSISNSAGYVDISLVNPVPITKSYTWDKTWTIVNQQQRPPNVNWRSITYGNGIFVAVGYRAAMYSVDGITINFQPIDGDLFGVSFENGTFVAVGENIQIFSNDGYTWTLSSTQISGTWYAIASGNNTFVAAGPGVITSTDNGFSWTIYQLSDYYYKSIAYGIGFFIAISFYGRILISTNGTTWSSLVISDQSFQSIAFGNGKFTIVGPSVILTSSTPNQSDWPSSTIPYPNDQDYIIGFGNNQFVVFGSYSGEFFSTDGITWSTGYFPNIYTYATSVAYGNNRFVLVGQNVPVPFYLSYQNINKFIIPYYTFNTPDYFFPYIYKVIWVPQLSSFVATVSQKGFMISSDGKIWNYVDGNAGRRFNSIAWSPELGVCVALGANGGGLYSNDLNTWTTVTCPVTNDYYGWCSITWSLLLGIFVAVGCVINAGDQPVTYSQDGIVWNTPAVSAPSSTWKSVTWSPDKKIFVAVAGSSISTDTITRGSFATMSSSDGKNWTGNNSLSVIWNDVTWSTPLGLFVAVGENAIMYSSDGTNWTNVSIPGMIFNSVTWSTELSLFVAGGGNTQSYLKWSYVQASKPVYTSSDGKTWTPSSYYTQLGTSIAWSPELGLFAGPYGTINHAFAYSNSNISF